MVVATKSAQKQLIGINPVRVVRAEGRGYIDVFAFAEEAGA